MKKLRLLASFVLMFLMFTMVSSVAAQSYTFQSDPGNCQRILE